MGYYGRSMYRGDFYRGARGDFWDDVGGVLGTVGGTIEKGLALVPGVSKVLNASNAAFNRTIAPAHPAMSSPTVGGGGLSLSPSIVIPGVGAGRLRLGKGKAGSRPIDLLGAQAREDRNDGYRSRRMNACNPKALRRAMRRTAAFMGFAKKYVKLINPKAHVEMRHKPLKHHHKK